MPERYTFQQVLDNYWSRVEKTDNCWHWTGPYNHKGYGAFFANGEHWRAHRLAWTFANGEIPDGMHVMHTCDNRKCVNPAHLRVGTPMENEHDKISKGRNCRGERVNGAVLTEAIVRQIRSSNRSDKDWADELGVHATTVRNARIGKKWAHVK